MINYTENFSKAILTEESNDSSACVESGDSPLDRINEKIYFCYDCNLWVAMDCFQAVCAECGSYWIS
jgi:ribosomal protein L37AE/L43A